MNGDGAAPPTAPRDVSESASVERAILRLCACGGHLVCFEGVNPADVVSWHNLSLSHRIWRWAREAIDEQVH